MHGTSRREATARTSGSAAICARTASNAAASRSPRSTVTSGASARIILRCLPRKPVMTESTTTIAGQPANPPGAHGEPVDADAEPAGRRHAVLERAQVVLVDLARRLGVLARDLRLEALPLVDRIVQLGEGVRELPSVHEEFEALDEVGPVGTRLAERRDRGRVERHERRLHEIRLDARLEQRLEDLVLRRAAHLLQAELVGLAPQRARVGGID